MTNNSLLLTQLMNIIKNEEFMNLVIPYDEIIKLVHKQIDNIFNLENNEKELINNIFQKVLERCERNFSNSSNKYYTNNGITKFNPYHSGQYCIFLYYLSNEVWKNGNSILADKVYYLNKTLNSCDLFYEVELPNIFMLDHPVGSVMGRAKYSDFFSFGQNCTIGNNKGVYPRLMGG